MTTKEQAEQAAEEILAFERAGRLQARNARARRLPWYFRVAGLARKQPCEREELFKQAQARVMSGPHFWLALGVWAAGMAAVWYGFVPSTVAPSVGTVIVALLGLRVTHALFMRRQLAALLQAESDTVRRDP